MNRDRESIIGRRSETQTTSFKHLGPRNSSIILRNTEDPRSDLGVESAQEGCSPTFGKGITMPLVFKSCDAEVLVQVNDNYGRDSLWDK